MSKLNDCPHCGKPIQYTEESHKDAKKEYFDRKREFELKNSFGEWVRSIFN